MTGIELGHKIRGDVVIGPSNQSKWNALPVEVLLQLRSGLPNLWPGIMVQTWQNVRRTGDD